MRLARSGMITRWGGAIFSIAALLPAGACSGRAMLPPEQRAAFERRILEPLAALEREPESHTPQQPELPERPITLAEATQLALRNNHDLRIARTETRISQQQVLVARSALLPQISGSYGFATINPQLVNEVEGKTFPILEREFNRAELSVQWLIWDFGRTLGKWQQAELGRDISELTRRRVAQGVIFRTAQAYFNVLRARAATIVANEALTSAGAQLRVAGNLYDNGLVDKTDVLRAQVQVAEFRRELIAADNDAQVATSALNRVMGISINWPTQVAEVARPPDFEADLLAALKLAVQQRPELQVVQKAILLEQTGVTVAKADFYPEIVAFGRYQYFENDFSPDNHYLLTDFRIGLNIWSGGRKVFALRQARERVSKAIATAEQVCDTIALEVKQAFLGIDSARRRVAVSETAVRQARENRRITYAKYRQTAATSSDVLAAETLYVRARQEYFRALYDLIMAIQRLEFSMGTNDLSDRPFSGSGAADAGRRDDNDNH